MSLLLHICPRRYQPHRRPQRVPRIFLHPLACPHTRARCHLQCIPSPRRFSLLLNSRSIKSPSSLDMMSLQVCGVCLAHMSSILDTNGVCGVGSYLVDPELPATASANTSSLLRTHSDDSLRKVGKHAMREARKAFGEGERRMGGLLRGLPPVVNASFRTRHGDISLDVGIVGSSPESPSLQRSRARMLVSSRHGHIRVHIVRAFLLHRGGFCCSSFLAQFEIQQGRCLDVDVSSRTGALLVAHCTSPSICLRKVLQGTSRFSFRQHTAVPSPSTHAEASARPLSPFSLHLPPAPISSVALTTTRASSSLQAPIPTAPSLPNAQQRNVTVRWSALVRGRSRWD